jgi:D-alanyl-D-alanine endopeptidase (penicillin-binding protein 7)
MKKPVCFFVCVFLVLLIAKIEWNIRFRNLTEAQKAKLHSEGKIPFQSICISEKAKESHKLQLRSEAAVVLDTKEGEVLFEKNIEKELPIASLTKLMSALVFQETNPNLNDTVTITIADARYAGRSQLRVGETFTLSDLLHTSLMSSSNRDTKTLARATGFSPLDFVARMNRKAKELGLKNTFFYEPTGLDEKNRSTALDCAKLLFFALQDSVIASISTKTTYEFISRDIKKRKHRIGSTNKLLFSSLNVKGGKTGYNGASGWCLGTLVEGEDGNQMVAVILGAPTKHTRFREIRSIVEWSIDGHKKGS